MIIDSHAHLDANAFDKDRAAVVARAVASDVSTIITIGCDLESSRASVELANRFPRVFSTVGFHPHDAAKMTEDDLAVLGELSQHPKVVGIGEMGLDFYRNLSPRECQIAVFKRQLSFAAEVDKPVVIHSRNAGEETFDILSEWAKDRVRGKSKNGLLGVIHCFSGDVELARRYVDMGFLISIPGSITYPTAKQIEEVVRETPIDRLLVETDCPFLAPVPYRSQRNEPSYVPIVVDRIASVKEIPPKVVAYSTAQNAIRLFSLPQP